MSALGYDHSTDDYKLVIGTVEPPESKDTLVQVYSLASNSWKPGQTVPLKFHMQKHGVFVNGKFHWLVTPQVKYFLLSLDISDESFKEMQLSEELLEKSKDLYMILGVLEGLLCVLFTSYVNGNRTHCEVWEMLDYGVEESWTRRHIITHEHITNSFIAFPRWNYNVPTQEISQPGLVADK
ncbi:F-box protein CPR1-like [Papaver somniferum]|uniref:F-box protein CPR1-like n=1 Tax=Papaver somniferum TaxID=3469 RepID=UPI000E6F59A3|nr:F-box protein CPR1-like [Papaver somniferum]